MTRDVDTDNIGGELKLIRLPKQVHDYRTFKRRNVLDTIKYDDIITSHNLLLCGLCAWDVECLVEHRLNFLFEISCINIISYHDFVVIMLFKGYSVVSSCWSTNKGGIPARSLTCQIEL